MPVIERSRYATAKLADLTLPSGERRPYVYGRGTFSPNNIGSGATNWSVSSADTLDLMAASLLGGEDRWWVIADVNTVMFPEFDTELTNGPFVLHVGQELIVPPQSILTGE